LSKLKSAAQYPSLYSAVSQFFLRLLASSSSRVNQLFCFCQPSLHAAVSQFFLRLLASSSSPVNQLFFFCQPSLHAAAS
jgi:hypothetical protein